MDFGGDYGGNEGVPRAPAPAAGAPPARPLAAAPPAPAGFDELVAALRQPSLMDADLFGGPTRAEPAAAAAHAPPPADQAPPAAADAGSAVRPRALHGTFEASAASAPAPESPGFGESAFAAPGGHPAERPAGTAAAAAAAGAVADRFGMATSLLMPGSSSHARSAGPGPDAQPSGAAAARAPEPAQPARSVPAAPPAAAPDAPAPGAGSGSGEGAEAAQPGLAHAWSGPAPGHGQPRPGRGGQNPLDELFWAAVEGLHIERSVAAGLTARRAGAPRGRTLLARPGRAAPPCHAGRLHASAPCSAVQRRVGESTSRLWGNASKCCRAAGRAGAEGHREASAARCAACGGRGVVAAHRWGA